MKMEYYSYGNRKGTAMPRFAKQAVALLLCVLLGLSPLSAAAARAEHCADSTPKE